MSTIKTNQLAHTANGAAVYTLPQTDGSAGQVLRTDGSGNLSWVNDSGKILQVKSATKTGTASTNSATFADISGLSVTLTTPQSGSKIFVTCQLQIGSEDNNYAGFKLFRDSTAIGLGTEGTGNMSNVTFGAGLRGDFQYRVQGLGYEILDTHGADGSTNVTYKLQFATLYSKYVYINRPHTADNQSYNIFGSSSITAMEIAA